jgi:hypothetical protein
VIAANRVRAFDDSIQPKAGSQLHVSIEDVCWREPPSVLVLDENVKKAFENEDLDLAGVGQCPDPTYKGRIRLFDLHKKE